jgi:hypothetical protein
MRYLRKFNESLSKEEELQEFCESNLAYLLDEGFRINIKTVRPDSDNLTGIKITRKDNNFLFSWVEVKDYLIPFIERLSKSYQIDQNTYWWTPASEVNGRPAHSESGIIFDYIRPVFPENEWFNIPGQRVMSILTPDINDILNDNFQV